jgi:hypothetical protein
MSRNTIFISIYHRHTFLDLIDLTVMFGVIYVENLKITVK